MLKRMRNFLKNTSGSIVPTMAILTIPLGVAAGAAVDYSRYVNMRSEIQIGVDAAGIATIKALPDIQQAIPSDITGSAYNERLENDIKNYAENFLKANITSAVAKDGYNFSVEYIPSSINQLQSSVEIRADIEYDTIFGGLNGKDGGVLLFKDKIEDQIISLVKSGNRTVEIALVVDNSGSMAFERGVIVGPNDRPPPAPIADRRLTLLQTEARRLVENVFNAARNAQLAQPVQFSIVPFSTTVNVGDINHRNHRNGNRFLDRRGFASYHNENLDWVNTYRRKTGETVTLHRNSRAARLTRADGSRQWLTRLDIFPMLNTEWEGCVEMRPYPHNIQDTYKANNTAYNRNDAEKLFVPYMVPDAPDEAYFDFYSDSGNSIEFEDDNPPSDTGNNFRGSYIPDFYDYDADAELARPVFRNDNNFPNVLANGDQFPRAIDNGDIDSNQITRTNWVHKYQAYQGLVQSRIDALPDGTDKEIQLKKILNDLNIPTFEKNLNSLNRNVYFADSGPNAFCPDVPIMQLTENVTDINNTIDSMQAHGGTNIQQGLTWGWRTLSAARPFDTGRTLSDPNNRKILILLTDGNNQLLLENTANNTLFSSWGYQRTDDVLPHATTGLNSHGRLLEGDDDIANTIYDEPGRSIANNPTTQTQYEDLMNLHTNQACNNIKKDGVTIYTIAFDVPDGSIVKDLLENCAGSGTINDKEVVSGVEFYHDVVGLELQAVFTEISNSITAIRIAQ